MFSWRRLAILALLAPVLTPSEVGAVLKVFEKPPQAALPFQSRTPGRDVISPGGLRPVLPEPEPEVVVEPEPPARPSHIALSRTMRRAVQERLNALGFSVGAPDGIFGARTEAAIAEYQRSIGRKATGGLDQGTYAALDVRPPPAPAPTTTQPASPAPAPSAPSGGSPASGTFFATARAGGVTYSGRAKAASGQLSVTIEAQRGGKRPEIFSCSGRLSASGGFRCWLQNDAYPGALLVGTFPKLSMNSVGAFGSARLTFR